MKAPSLARQLLTWLIPTGLVLVAIGSLFAYQLAHRAATLAYDRALLDAAQSVTTQVSRVDSRLNLNLSPSTEQVLLFDNYDKIVYEVVDGNGNWISGTHGLTRPPKFENEEQFHYYDTKFAGQEMRAASMLAEKDGTAFIVTVAETLVKRDKLVREILLAMLVPELLLVVTTILVMYFAIRNGLGGIVKVREELAQRSHADLRPIPLDTVPVELRPLIADTNDLLERLSYSLQRHRHLIADASHQLRTPIAALRAEAEAALRSTDMRSAMERIAVNVQQLSRLAHNVLMLNRLEPGYIQHPLTIDLQALIGAAADRWLPLARERKIDLGFELDSASVPGEPIWLEELVSNLVDNALRYTPVGGIVTVKCGMAPDGVWLSVEDSGQGIPKAEREKIFERFYRSHPDDGEGSGLGLAIVHEVANAHRAHVEVADGQELGGALIRVIFPQAG